MQTQEVIEKAVEAYAGGDTAALDALLDEDLRYRINGQPDCGKFTCDVTGKAAFYDAVGGILARWEITGYQIVDLIVSGERAAAQVAQRLDAGVRRAADVQRGRAHRASTASTPSSARSRSGRSCSSPGASPWPSTCARP